MKHVEAIATLKRRLTGLVNELEGTNERITQALQDKEELNSLINDVTESIKVLGQDSDQTSINS